MHQDDGVALGVGEGELLVRGLQPLDHVGRAPALVLLRPGLDVAHVHLDDGIALARDHDVLANDGVALAFEFDDHAGTHLVGLHLCHGWAACPGGVNQRARGRAGVGGPGRGGRF